MDVFGRSMKIYVVFQEFFLGPKLLDFIERRNERVLFISDFSPKLLLLGIISLKMGIYNPKIKQF